MLHTNLQKSIQFACDVDSDSDQHQFQHGKLILHKVEQLFCGDSVRIMQKENGGFCHKMHPVSVRLTAKYLQKENGGFCYNMYPVSVRLTAKYFQDLLLHSECLQCVMIEAKQDEEAAMCRRS